MPSSASGKSLRQPLGNSRFTRAGILANGDYYRQVGLTDAGAVISTNPRISRGSYSTYRREMTTLEGVFTPPTLASSGKSPEPRPVGIIKLIW